MGKMKENPRYNMITARVSKEEWKEICEASKKDNVSISEYVRKRLFK